MPLDLKFELIDFLKSGRQSLSLDDEGEFTPESARQKLRELIPTEIIVKSRCRLAFSAVVAAPHVSFDGWSEYFSRRAAEDFGFGRVVARNFRDDNEFDIPVSIGRHLHVNRPTESSRKSGRERETERARNAFEEYVAALGEAGGGRPPLDLLIEFHGHRFSDAIEIATTGINRSLARSLVDSCRPDSSEFGQALFIEPLNRIHFTARKAKSIGSMQPKFAVRALHIEIPRDQRRPEPRREGTWESLRPFIRKVVDLYS